MGEYTAVDELLERQEEMWERGECVSAETLLAGHPTLLADPPSALAVIWNERRLRSQLPHQELEFQRAEYQRRFPHLAVALDRQFDCESALIAVDTAPVDADETVERGDGARQPQISGYHQFEPPVIGGFGCVYKARQIIPDRAVAIKITRDGGDVSTAGVRSLRTEAERVARLRHVNIVEIYEVGSCGGSPYFVMPFVEGKHLGESRANYVGKSQQVVNLVLQIAGAVQYAHSLGILHCDIKPQNVLIDRDGRPLLTDFGLAVALALPGGDGSDSLTGKVVPSLSSTFGTGGTPDYMAPEQHSGRRSNLTVQTDVYGIGGVLYFLLTGREPGDVSKRPVDLSLLSRDKSIPGELAAICRKCLSSSIGGRYESAEAIAKELELFLTGRPVEGMGMRGIRGAWYRLRKWRARNPWPANFVLAIAGGVCVVVALLAFYAGVLSRQNADLTAALNTAADTSFDLGGMAASRGSKPRSEVAYRRALGLFERLVGQYPDHPSYRFQLAKTRNNLGSLLGELGRGEEAEAQLRAALVDLEVLERLPNCPSGVPQERAGVHANIGNYHLRGGHLGEAEKAFLDAETIRAELAKSGDQLDRFALAKSQIDLGNVCREGDGRAEEAMSRYRLAIDELTALIAAGLRVPEASDRLQQATMNLAIVYVDHGRPVDADTLYQSAVDRWDALIRLDPHNTEYQRSYALALTNAGARQLDAGRIPEGTGSLTRAEQEFHRVMRQEEVSAATLGQYGVCLANLAQAHWRFSAISTSPEQSVTDSRIARDCAVKSLHVLQQWGHAEPAAAEPLIYQASAATTLGHLAFGERNVSEAKAKYEQALNFLDAATRPTVTARFDTLTVLSNLGRACLDQDPPELSLAEKHFNRGVRDGETLADRNPTHAGVRTRLMSLYDGLGLVALRRHESLSSQDQKGEPGRRELRRASACFTEAIRCGELAGKAVHQEADVSRVFNGVYARRASLGERLGDFAGAIKDWRVAVDQSDEKDPMRVIYSVGLASASARSGDHSGAVEVLRKLGGAVTRHPEGPFNAACVYALACKAVDADTRMTTEMRRQTVAVYTQKAVAALKQAEGGGLFQSEQGQAALLTDDDLAFIRGAAEFKSFVESITAGKK